MRNWGLRRRDGERFLLRLSSRTSSGAGAFSLALRTERRRRAGCNPALRAERRKACEQAYNSDPIGLEICNRASAGHPNPQGARAFAEEVLAVIDTNGLLGPARFPAGFLWGGTTAAYQVEGGIENNDWHLFTTDRNIRERVNFLGTAVNLDIHLQPAGDGMSHRHLDTLGQDLDRMVALGMNAYRFSIEWSQVRPRPTRFSRLRSTTTGRSSMRPSPAASSPSSR